MRDEELKHTPKCQFLCNQHLNNGIKTNNPTPWSAFSTNWVFRYFPGAVDRFWSVPETRRAGFGFPATPRPRFPSGHASSSSWSFSSCSSDAPTFCIYVSCDYYRRNCPGPGADFPCLNLWSPRSTSHGHLESFVRSWKPFFIIEKQT